MTKPLNVRQARFCEFIAAGESQTDAYIKAGFNVDKSVARRNAARLLTNADIQKRLSELRKTQTQAALSTRDHKRRTLFMLMEDPRQKTHDRLRAMEIDARLAGQFEPDRTEIEVAPKTLLSIKERAAQVESALARRYQQPVQR